MSFDRSADPFASLDLLVKQATEAGLKDPNAMALATCEPATLQPSVRIVLYKGLVRGGLSFYTNYEGRKGQELTANDRASVCFFWTTMDTQIRVEGRVARLTREESEAYFRTRPRLSQLGAWASAQSSRIADLESLQAKVDSYEKEFAGADIPCPPHWGGFHLVPTAFEFWFAKQGRLHERYCYERDRNGWRSFMRSP